MTGKLDKQAKEFLAAEGSVDGYASGYILYRGVCIIIKLLMRLTNHIEEEYDDHPMVDGVYSDEDLRAMVDGPDAYEALIHVRDHTINVIKGE